MAAGFGMGLGAFVDGMARGINMRGAMEDREAAREDRERQRKIEDERLQWDREDRARRDEEYNRAKAERDALDGIRTDGRAEFDRGVSAGEYDPKEYDEFFESYVMPKMATELLEQGKFEQADALQTWGESKATKRAGRLFSEAMFKASSGDFDGALDAAFEAAKVRGYMDPDFKFVGKEEIVDQAGTVLGYQITMKDENGNEHVQEVAVDDIPAFVAMSVNPETAFQSKQQAAAKKAERTEKITDTLAIEEGKAAIERRGDDQKLWEKAVENVQKRVVEAGDDDGGWDALSDTQQQELVQREFTLLKGTGGAPAVPQPTMVVDQNTGRSVGVSPTPPGPAKGLGSVPAPSQPVVDTTPPVATTGQAPVDQGLALPTEQQMLDNAANMLVNGERPENVARMLQQTGIDPSRWPQGLVQ